MLVDILEIWEQLWGIPRRLRQCCRNGSSADWRYRSRRRFKSSVPTNSYQEGEEITRKDYLGGLPMVGLSSNSIDDDSTGSTWQEGKLQHWWSSEFWVSVIDWSAQTFSDDETSVSTSREDREDDCWMLLMIIVLQWGTVEHWCIWSSTRWSWLI